MLDNSIMSYLTNCKVFSTVKQEEDEAADKEKLRVLMV